LREKGESGDKGKGKKQASHTIIYDVGVLKCVNNYFF